MELYNGIDFWAEGEEPISDAAISLAEKRLGVKLPPSYKELLKVKNGGTLNFPKFFLEEKDKQRITIPEINGIDFEGEKGILASKHWIKECGLPDHIIILWGDYHSWIALNYEETTEHPTVVYFYTDYENWSQIQIAKDFDRFLKKLSRGHILNPVKLKPSYTRKKM
ncbi:SMI1/KNR4 family protein [Bacillus sp. SJS]|uniref:SMI1/KNR4 family protein n=1 Tax=Bacillus sp. SJS TaxID=1423321 RepID=UPI00068E6C11|nr:SMI1/KNR4 family protein [Bacillus sp. SJS]KZZ85760.1 hypothetical protein AS29_004000 [Bacillus sp. SJS]